MRPQSSLHQYCHHSVLYLTIGDLDPGKQVQSSELEDRRHTRNHDRLHSAPRRPRYRNHSSITTMARTSLSSRLRRWCTVETLREKIALPKASKFLGISRWLVSVVKNLNDEVMKHCIIGSKETVIKSCTGDVDVCERVGLGMLQTSSFWPTMRITPSSAQHNQMLVSDMKHLLTTIGQQTPCANSIRYYWSACWVTIRSAR